MIPRTVYRGATLTVAIDAPPDYYATVTGITSMLRLTKFGVPEGASVATVDIHPYPAVGDEWPGWTLTVSAEQTYALSPGNYALGARLVSGSEVLPTKYHLIRLVEPADITPPGPPSPPVIIGTGNVTLDGATGAGTGSVTGGGVTGSGAVALDDATGSGAGTVTFPPVTGSGAVTLDDATGAGSGVVTGGVTGTGSTTLDDAVGAGSGTVAFPPVTGSGSVTLDDAVGAGSGSVAPSSGLLFRSDGTMTGWTGNSGDYSSDAASPSLISFQRPAILAATPGTPDAGGDREGFHFIDTDGTRYMFTGSGDGTNGAGGPWRPQYAYSTDGGLTWTKLGPMSMGLTNGLGGSWASTDNLFFEKRGSFYYLHRLTAAAVTQNICTPPYTSDVWRAASVTGTYTYQRATVALTSGGTFAERDAYASCMVLNAGTYYLFWSATTNAPEYQVSYSTGTSPDGPFTPIGSAILPVGIKGQPENPEVFWHAGINKWVMICNQVNLALGKTDLNRVFFSNSLTDWSAASWHDIQRVAPLDGVEVIGLSRATRSATDNLPIFDALGNVPIIYDTDPTGTGSPANHIGRKIRYGVLQPSAAAISRTLPTPSVVFSDNFTTETLGNIGGQNGWTNISGVNPQPQVAQSSSTRYLDMQSTVGASACIQAGTITDCKQFSNCYFGTDSGVGFIFAWKSAVQPHYRLDFCQNGTNTLVYVDAVGGETVVAGGFNGANAMNTSLNHTIEGTLNGATFVAKVDGATVVSFTDTDSTRIAALVGGGRYGLRNGFGGTNQRYILTYTVSDQPTNATAPIFRALTHADAVFDYAINGTGGNVDLFYRLQSATSGANGYRIRLDMSGAGPVASTASKVVGGTVTGLGGNTGTRTINALATFPHRVKITVSGSTHTVAIDGETQLSFTDATYATGVGIGQSCDIAVAYKVRALNVRKSDTVTVQGLTNGQVVTLRAAGGLPMATAVASGTTATITGPYFPASSIDVAGVQRYAVSGGIWGGEVFG